MRRLAFLALALAGCSSERLDQLDARLTELKAENERLSRDLADLRRGTTASAATPANAAAPAPAAAPAAAGDRVLELEAGMRALLETLSRTLPPPTGRIDGELPGVWRASTPESMKKDPHGALEVVVHYGDGGRLCGYRLLAGAAHEKQPFWGRWERHGRLVLELRDRWVGDHNEHDGELRALDALDGESMVQDGGERLRFTRVPADAAKKLASLYDDREVPIPGLPAWCFHP